MTHFISPCTLEECCERRFCNYFMEKDQGTCVYGVPTEAIVDYTMVGYLKSPDDMACPSGDVEDLSVEDVLAKFKDPYMGCLGFSSDVIAYETQNFPNVIFYGEYVYGWREPVYQLISINYYSNIVASNGTIGYYGENDNVLLYLYKRSTGVYITFPFDFYCVNGVRKTVNGSHQFDTYDYEI